MRFKAIHGDGFESITMDQDMKAISGNCFQTFLMHL